MSTKGEIFIAKYQRDRALDWAKEGHYRCNDKLVGKEECKIQCHDCKMYYERALEKLLKK